MNARDLQNISDWLIDGARSAASPAHMMAETCERLVQAGLPLWRVGVFVRTLHPEIFGRNFIWKPGAEVEIGTVDFGNGRRGERTGQPRRGLLSLMQCAARRAETDRDAAQVNARVPHSRSIRVR